MPGVLRSGALVTSLLFGVAACAPLKPPSVFETDFEEENKPWTEMATQLPPVPEPSALTVFPVSGATSYVFAIDRQSIAIGSDGVFRFTLVATSSSGVRNVSYEGIRCQTQEKKLYATARSDGTWVRSRTSAWTRIEEVGNNRQEAALMKEYFCPEGYPAQDVAEIGARFDHRPPPLNAS